MSSNSHPRAKFNPLTACVAFGALALGAAAISGSAPATVSSADAATPPGGGGLVSAAEQRKQMLGKMSSMESAVKALDKRLASIEKTLSKGLDVRVKEMPRQRDGD